jgi:O-antigen biosynthesis protein
MTRKRVRKRAERTPKTLVDIIIPVHRRFDILGECLGSIPDAVGDIPHKIIIFDNASPLEEADAFYPSLDKSIKIARSKQNVGFPRACNQGAQRGTSPLLFFLNSDVVLEKESIDKMVRVMDEPKVGVVGMKLVFPDEDYKGLNENIRPAGTLQHVGLSVNIRSQVHHPFMAWNPDHPRVMMQKEVAAVTGAALMTRRHLWNKAKGFFEGYGMGTYEDVDYCFTIREMGYNIQVEPFAVGTHYTGATAEGYGLGYNLNYNQMTFMQRWGQKLEWWDYKIL